MKSELIIDIFRPECFSWNPSNQVDLYNIMGKEWHYASKGRYALYHILKNNNVKGKILVPVYVCDTVLKPLLILGIEPVFYDIDLRDLNGDIESIEKIGVKHNVSAVLVVSMYGNPADYVAIQQICQKYNWLMIDDGAQAIGAELDGKVVGTFGDAGFYSFSPGKPVAGPMGAFYWQNKMYHQSLFTKHDWFHKLIYYEFYVNRVGIYDDYSWLFRKMLSAMVRLFSKLLDIKNDRMADFEKKVLSGILYESIRNYERKKYSIICNIIEAVKPYRYRFLRNIRGKGISCKLIIIAENKKIASELIQFLKCNRIYSSNGYKMLVADVSCFRNASMIDGCIVEIPVESNVFKCKTLIEVLNRYYEKNIN